MEPTRQRADSGRPLAGRERVAGMRRLRGMSHPVPSPDRRSPRRAVALALFALVLSGCLSVRSRQAAGVPGEGGGVTVSIYADDGARRARVPGPPGVSSELSCWE